MNSACPVKWTMVVDNVDDRATFFEATSETGKALIEYIPSTAHGTIIYTTRSRDIAIELLPTNDPIAVESLSFDEAQALLSEQLVRGNTKTDLLELFEALEYLPLGLSHAAAYMIKRRKKVADYLGMIKDDSTKSQLLSQKGYHHGRAERSSESVFSTWWVTFRSIKRENSRAADLLAMMSLLDRHKIPLSILRYPEEISFDFEEAVSCLEAFSLITTFSDAELRDAQALELLKQGTGDRRECFFEFGEMHRLVQQSTKAWLRQQEVNAVETATKPLELVWHAIPSREGDTRTWPLFDLIYPHAKELLSYNMETFGFTKDLHEAYPDNLPYRTHLLDQISRYLFEQGRYTQSEQSASISVQIRKMYLGDGHELTMDSMSLCARAVCELGRTGEACKIQGEIVRGLRSHLGDRDPETLRSVSSLGHYLTRADNIVDAGKVLEEALVDQRRYCLEHPYDEFSQRELMGTIGDMATVLQRQGEPRQALNLLDEAVELGKINHLEDSRNILSKVECYSLLGDYKEAQSLIQPILHRRRELYGETHPKTLNSLQLYSMLLRAEDQSDEAEEIMQSLCKACADTAWGNAGNHISNLNRLGMTQYDLGKFEKAEITFRQILATLGKANGRSDNAKRFDEEDNQDMIRKCLKGQGKLEDAKVDMSRPHHNISVHIERKDEIPILETEGPRFSNDVEAEVLLREELQTQDGECGSKRDDRDMTRLELARCLYRQQRYEEALDIAHEVLAWRKRSKGWVDQRTQEALQFLAECSEDSGKHDESINHWQRLLLGQRYHFGSNSFETYTARCAIARFLLQKANFEDAEKALRKISAIELAHPNECGTEDIACTLGNLGRALYNQDKFEEAEDAFRQAYNGYVELPSPGENVSSNTASILSDLGRSLYYQDKNEQAEDSFRQAYARYSELTHPSEVDSEMNVDTLFWLGCVSGSQGKFGEAEDILSQAYDRHVKLYGKCHADTVKTLISLVRSLEDQGKNDQASELYHLLGTTKALPSADNEENSDCLSDDEKDSDWITEDDEYPDHLSEDEERSECPSEDDESSVGKSSLEESENGSS